MTLQKHFLPDFIELQRKSFFRLLEKGLIEEVSKRNPITNRQKTLELLFYPECYKLSPPKWNAKQSILESTTYAAKFYIPTQLIDRKTKKIEFKWVLIGDLPLMTKRGHFIVNGAARVIINQIIRGPGIYFNKIIEKGETINSNNNLPRYYAEFISMRGTWLRLSIGKKKRLWAEMKKTPKIPLLWFLLGMGLSERIIFHSIKDANRLFFLYDSGAGSGAGAPLLTKEDQEYFYINSPSKAWELIYWKVSTGSVLKNKNQESGALKESKTLKKKAEVIPTSISGPLALNKVFGGKVPQTLLKNFKKVNSSGAPTPLPSEVGQGPRSSLEELLKQSSISSQKHNLKHLKQNSGRLWIFKKFMNPRNYDIGVQGRLCLNRKFNLAISHNHRTLTPYDILYATDYLIQLEQGKVKTDDIDHLKNRRVRTSSDLIQLQIGVGLIRLEKFIRDKINESKNPFFNSKESVWGSLPPNISVVRAQQLKNSGALKKSTSRPTLISGSPLFSFSTGIFKKSLFLSNLISTKPLNGALREFFGTSPLSQFLDQINPLAEITHKRRMTSLGPGGVSRDTATMAIRGIHPTHYGRICPVDTPEGKNAGLVNAITIYSRVNVNGLIETPFYKVFKGQIQKQSGLYYFSADLEDLVKTAASDICLSKMQFLPLWSLPARNEDQFVKISRSNVDFMAISPIQMISVATCLVPFLEHDDANRALMGANMQRQAVPIINPEQPIVQTGIESKIVSDSGHAIQAKFGGIVSYVCNKKIIVSTLV
uniref:DNA-directed RNA polymerase n=1 Tax=Koshicola spirodelophila TaxID=1707787 RepID=A0A160E770_9CHLO|nr:beta subunit of RNA polymerase a [Koshicola spirodelophila]